MMIWGQLEIATRQVLLDIREATDGLAVTRSGRAKSSIPLPVSTDLEVALVPFFEAHAF